MKNVRPAFKKLLLVAVVVYVIGSCLIQADLYRRLGEAEHILDHLCGAAHPAG